MQSRSLNFPTKTGYQNIESIEHIDYILKLKFPSPLPNWQLREALHKRNGHLITIMMTIVLMMTMMTMKMMTVMIMGCWVCWHWGNDSLTLSTLLAITPHCCALVHCAVLRSCTSECCASAVLYICLAMCCTAQTACYPCIALWYISAVWWTHQADSVPIFTGLLYLSFEEWCTVVLATLYRLSPATVCLLLESVQLCFKSENSL